MKDVDLAATAHSVSSEMERSVDCLHRLENACDEGFIRELVCDVARAMTPLVDLVDFLATFETDLQDHPQSVRQTPTDATQAQALLFRFRVRCAIERASLLSDDMATARDQSPDRIENVVLGSLCKLLAAMTDCLELLSWKDAEVEL